MQTINKNDIIRYLRVVKDCELLCAKQTALKDYFIENEMPKEKRPEDIDVYMPEEPDSSDVSLFAHVFFNPVISAIGIVGSVIIFFKAGFTFETFGQVLLYWLKWVGILYVALFFLGYIFAICTGFTWRAKCIVKRVEEEKQRYKNEEERLERQYKEKKELYDYQINVINKDLMSCKTFLECLYSMDILYYKYRNLIAVSSILEYFESGRADTFKEAYNIFETEHRLDNINAAINKFGYKLDSIARQLDYMQDSLSSIVRQQDLFVTEYKKDYDRLISSIERNEANTAQSVEYARKSLENSLVMREIAEGINEKNKYIENTFAEHFSLNPITGTYQRRL